MKEFKSISFYIFFLFISCIYAIELYLPTKDPQRSNRQAEIFNISLKIKNEPRAHLVNGVYYPINNGPVPYNNSLAQKILHEELALLNTYANQNITNIARTVAATLPSLNNVTDYDILYDNLEQYVPRPKSSISGLNDTLYGRDRLTIKGANLKHISTFPSNKIFYLREYSSKNISYLTDGECDKLYHTNCSKRLYFIDYSDFWKYNDPLAPQKNTPGAQALFYLNSLDELNIIAIKIFNKNDSSLIYTKLDTKNEWDVAKMAFNTAETNDQQWTHFVDSHLIIEPIRVEMMRTMSSRHPIYVILNHHFRQLLANTIMGLQLLLSSNTTLDTVSGMGATGGLRLLNVMLKNKTFEYFEDALRKRKLNDIPNFPFRDDARMYLKAIEKFVLNYLKLYYGSDRSRTNTAVILDEELQNWANASSLVCNGFPSSFTSLQQVTKVVSQLIFSTTVRHHSLNSFTTWDTISYPYSTMGLWKVMPERKGKNIQLMDYITPKTILPAAVALPASFYRTVPANLSLMYSYDNLDLGNNTLKIKNQWKRDLTSIKRKILFREQNQLAPYYTLLPENLAHYVWI